jgi:hypothetical protein
MSLKIRTATALASGVALGSLLFAAPPTKPGITPVPINCQAVGYQGMLSAVGTIKPVAPNPAPAGSCSQIRFTAWRNNFDYNCNDALTPHESVTATGPNLSKCAYDLPVEMGHRVQIKATSSIPGARVVLTYNDSSETSVSIWEEKHPVHIDWLLKPIGLVPHLSPVPHKSK